METDSVGINYTSDNEYETTSDNEHNSDNEYNYTTESENEYEYDENDELEFNKHTELALQESLKEFNDTKSALEKDLASNLDSLELAENWYPVYPLIMCYDYDKYKHLENTNKFIAPNIMLSQFDDINTRYINYEIFNKSKKYKMVVTPFDFIMDDKIYIPYKIFTKLKIKPGNYLQFKIKE